VDPDLEIAKRMFDAWNSGNVDRMTEFWSDDGDWIWEDAPEIPDARVVRGREQVEEHLRGVIGLMGEMEIKVEELVDLGDEVLAVIRFNVHGAQSGIELDVPAFQLLRFENGRVRRYRMFMDREQALRAARAG
jgi:ketosteroid isomerase-like protein